MKISIEYLAGFFDGEGSVSTCHSNSLHPTAKANVGQLEENKIILEEFRALWGGNITRSPSRLKSLRPVVLWSISGPKLTKFLFDIKDALVIKRRQAILALTLQSMISPRPRYCVPEGEAWLRRRLAKAISNLNKGRPLGNGFDTIKISPKIPKNDYFGVSKAWRPGKWSAGINVNGKWIHIGTFNSIKEAAEARQLTAQRLQNSEEVGGAGFWVE